MRRCRLVPQRPCRSRPRHCGLDSASQARRGAPDSRRLPPSHQINTGLYTADHTPEATPLLFVEVRPADREEGPHVLAAPPIPARPTTCPTARADGAVDLYESRRAMKGDADPSFRKERSLTWGAPSRLLRAYDALRLRRLSSPMPARLSPSKMMVDGSGSGHATAVCENGAKRHWACPL